MSLHGALGVRWRGIDLSAAPPAEPVAFGGELTPPELLDAYRCGVFPLPADGPGGALINRTLHEIDVMSGRIGLLPGRADPFDLAWHCPDPMPVLRVGGVHLSRTLRGQLRNRYSGWRTTANYCFAEVVDACARGRTPAWLTDELVSGLHGLHTAGWAHSIEVWDGDTLIGGLFGVGTGAVFSGDSMFHTVPDASKVAVADLADRLAATPVRLIGVQVLSPHVVAAGATTLDRARYLAALTVRADRVDLDPSVLPAARLAAPSEGKTRP
jgi:leucyl/phenylalanyl-tRNA--protein transferase